MWDNETAFSVDQPFEAGGSDSENTVDSGGDDLGLGGQVVLQVAVTAAPDTALSVRLDAAAEPDMADADPVATYLVPAERVGRGGVVLAAPLPTGSRRYLRLHYAGPASGRVTAGLVQGAQTNGM